MKKIRTAGKILILAVLIGTIATVALNAYVCKDAGKQILSAEEAAALEDVDCILVLGCSVREDGTPSEMLRDRVEMGITLYQQGVAGKLLMSGDHGRQDYNEVQTMKNMAVEAGVPAEDVFMDHAGFSTYESMYRAGEIFQAKNIVIVTQEYHLYRAIYIAEHLGLTAYGVAADRQEYRAQWVRDLREAAARVKDFFTVRFRVKPTFLGEAIPVNGNGNSTNDTQFDQNDK